MKRNPDGTRTRAEHERQIRFRMQKNMDAGMDADDALMQASADWQAFLTREGDRKIALVKRWLQGAAS